MPTIVPPSTITTGVAIGAAGGDHIFVLDDIDIISTDDSAPAAFDAIGIEGYDNNKVTVHGTVHGDLHGIRLGLEVAGGEVFVGDTGNVSGNRGSAIVGVLSGEIGGGGRYSVVNNGDVSNTSKAATIHMEAPRAPTDPGPEPFYSGDFSVVNNSLIANSHFVPGTTAIRFVNVGTLGEIYNAEDGVITAIGDMAAAIEVTGQVGFVTDPDTGDVTGERLSELRFVNAGEVYGEWYSYDSLGRGNDHVTNTGILRGDVRLGDDADHYNGEGGEVFGTVFGGRQADHLIGGALADTFDGGTGADILEGMGGDDILAGGEGNDLIEGGTGADDIDGGAGTDTAGYRASLAGVTVDLEEGTGSGGDASGDMLVSIENVTGSSLADTLLGNDVANVLRGAAGNDVLDGRAGDDGLFGGGGGDMLTGGDGNDTLNGGGGADVLEGGAGADEMIGGAGIDLASYAGATGVVAADLLSGGSVGHASGDTYATIENLTGSGFADDLRGNAGDNVLRGRDGNDQLIGRGGNDVIEGGRGFDLLFGNGGSDSFLYTGLGQGGDTIVDFVAGTDRITLSETAFTSLAAGAVASGNFVTGPAAVDADDYLVYNGGTGELFYDGDGAGGADGILIATLTGAPAITEADIFVV